MEKLLKKIEKTKQVKKLIDYLNSDYWIIRKKSAEKIAKLASLEKIRKYLVDNFNNENVVFWLLKILMELGKYGAEVIFNILIEESFPEQLLNVVPSKEFINLIKNKFFDLSKKAKIQIVKYLDKYYEFIDDEEFVMKLTSEKLDPIKKFAAKVLRNFTDPVCVYMLLDLVSSEDEQTRYVAIESLGILKQKVSIELSNLITQYLKQKFFTTDNQNEQLILAEVLSQYELENDVEKLLSMLSTNNLQLKAVIYLKLLQLTYYPIIDSLLLDFEHFDERWKKYFAIFVKNELPKVRLEFLKSDKLTLESKILFLNLQTDLDVEIVKQYLEQKEVLSEEFINVFIENSFSYDEEYWEKLIEKIDEVNATRLVKAKPALLLHWKKLADLVFEVSPKILAAAIAMLEEELLPNYLIEYLEKLLLLDSEIAFLAVDKLLKMGLLSVINKYLEVLPKEVKLWILSNKIKQRDYFVEILKNIIISRDVILVSFALNKLAENMVVLPIEQLEKVLEMDDKSKIALAEYLRVVDIKDKERLLLKLLDDENVKVKMAAISALDRQLKNKLLDKLILLLDHEYWPIRKVAAEALIEVDEQLLLTRSYYMYKNINYAYWLIYVFGEKKIGAKQLIEFYNKTDSNKLKNYILQALSKIGDKISEEFLLSLKDDRENLNVIRALKDIEREELISYWKEILESNDEEARIWAAYALSRFAKRNEKVRSYLLKNFINDDNFWVRNYIRGIERWQ